MPFCARGGLVQGKGWRGRRGVGWGRVEGAGRGDGRVEAGGANASYLSIDRIFVFVFCFGERGCGVLVLGLGLRRGRFRGIFLCGDGIK